MVLTRHCRLLKMLPWCVCFLSLSLFLPSSSSSCLADLFFPFYLFSKTTRRDVISNKVTLTHNKRGFVAVVEKRDLIGLTLSTLSVRRLWLMGPTSKWMFWKWCTYLKLFLDGLVVLISEPYPCPFFSQPWSPWIPLGSADTTCHLWNTRTSSTLSPESTITHFKIERLQIWQTFQVDIPLWVDSLLRWLSRSSVSSEEMIQKIRCFGGERWQAMATSLFDYHGLFGVKASVVTADDQR